MAKTGDIEPQFLSASTSGRQIKVVATATAGTLIHTAVAGATSVDFITIEACNTHTSDVVLTLEWGGVTDPDDLITITLPPDSGATAVVTMRMLNGGLAVNAFASVADVVVIGGGIRRVTL